MITLTKEEKNKNTQLLQKAMGSKTGKEFAELINLSPSMFSRMIKGKYQKRFSLELIRSIDFYKENPLDNIFNQLYENNHYLSEKTRDPNKIKKIIIGQIVSEFINNSIKINIKNDSENKTNIFSEFLDPDLYLKINKKNWVFFVLDSCSFEEILSKTMILFYNAEKSNIYKISFIFTDEKLMKAFFDFYQNINTYYKNISIIYFDTTSLIFKEEVLKGCSENKQINTLFKYKKGEVKCEI